MKRLLLALPLFLLSISANAACVFNNSKWAGTLDTIETNFSYSGYLVSYTLDKVTLTSTTASANTVWQRRFSPFNEYSTDYNGSVDAIDQTNCNISFHFSGYFNTAVNNNNPDFFDYREYNCYSNNIVIGTDGNKRPQELVCRVMSTGMPINNFLGGQLNQAYFGKVILHPTLTP